MIITFDENGFIFVPDSSLGHRDNMTIAPNNTRFGFKNHAAITELQARLAAGENINIHVDIGFERAEPIQLEWLFAPALDVCDTFDELEQRIMFTYGAAEIQPILEGALQGALDFSRNARQRAKAA